MVFRSNLFFLSLNFPYRTVFYVHWIEKLTILYSKLYLELYFCLYYVYCTERKVLISFSWVVGYKLLHVNDWNCNILSKMDFLLVYVERLSFGRKKQRLAFSFWSCQCILLSKYFVIPIWWVYLNITFF